MSDSAQTTIKASIDLGTNTCLLLVAEVDPKSQKVTRVISDHSTVVRLGKGVDRTKRLDPQAMDRTVECLKTYARICKDAGVDPSAAVCVGTSASRDAENGHEFYLWVEQATGFRFRVISGDDEAKYTFLGGLLPGMDASQSAVIDIGGGSTEILSKTGGQSLDVGSVRYTERFLRSDPCSDHEFWALQEAVDQELRAFLPWRQKFERAPSLVAVAGTATTLMAWHLGLTRFDAQKIDGQILTRGDLHRMVEELKWRTVAEKEKLPGVEPGRADVLLAGAMILWRTHEVLDFPSCIVSTRGLRFGIITL